jgi:hypothetical protein
MKKNSKATMGANGITQVTPTCFFIAFVTTFGEIFLKYFWNIFEKFFKKFFKIKKNLHTILLNLMLKIWKNLYFQTNNPFTSPFIV